MGALLLGAVAVVGLLLASRKQQEAQAPAQGAAPEEEKTAPGGGAALVGGTGLATLATLGTTGAIAAAGVAMSMAGGELGQALTGDAGGGLWDFATGKAKIGEDAVSVGKVTGELALAGTAVNVGRAVGQEVDKALGGTGRQATGIAAQIGLGASFFCGYLFGALAGVSVGIFAAIIYPIVFIFDDARKLEYGRSKQHFRDYEAKWDETFQTLFDTLRMRGDLNETQIRRHLIPFVDGYMRQKNKLAFIAWMHRAHGIGVADWQHARFGEERGEYIGYRMDDGTLSPQGIHLRCKDSDFFGYVPPEDLETIVRPVYEYRKFKEEISKVEYDDEVNVVQAPEWIVVEGGWLREKNYLGSEFYAIYSKESAWLDWRTFGEKYYKEWGKDFVVGEETVYKDMRSEELMAAGELYCNCVEYAKWMQQPWGIGQTATSHGAYGRNQGLFEGTFDTAPFDWEARKGDIYVRCRGQGGVLVTGGKQVYFSDETGEFGVFVRED
jgi:hypothetical protein